jgi:WD40 repeat protein
MRDSGKMKTWLSRIFGKEQKPSPVEGDKSVSSQAVAERTPPVVRTFEVHAEYVQSVAFSADGRWAISGSRDKSVRQWEVASRRCVRTFEGHTHRVHSVALSTDGRWALSGSGECSIEDNTLRLWEVAYRFAISWLWLAATRRRASGIGEMPAEWEGPPLI